MGSRWEVLARPELVILRDHWFDRLEAVFSGVGSQQPLYLAGHYGWGQCNPYEAPERWVQEALDDVASHAEGLRDGAVFRPLTVECPLYGVHFIDALFGAHVFELGPGNWQCRPLDAPVGSLARPDLEAHGVWRLARRVAEAFLSADVPLPLFGMPTLSNALNIGLNLYGDPLLLALCADPEAAHRDLSVINDVILACHRWYLERLPLRQLQPVVSAGRTQPPGYGQVCGCATQLLSADQYREFILPADRAVLGGYPHGGMIHLCGSHTQHLPAWRGMPELRAVQLNDTATDDLPHYLAGLREDQVVYVVPTEQMPVPRILELTRGRRVVINAEPVSEGAGD